MSSKRTCKEIGHHPKNIDSISKKLYNYIKGGVLMNYQDKEKLGRLEEKFKLNFRVTRMFTEYLERYPEIIKKDL